MAATSLPLDYMTARERHLSARARHGNYQEHLMGLLGAADTGVDLERAMLTARSKGQHMPAIIKLAELESALDRASDALDCATEAQRRRVASQQAVLNSIHRNLDE